MAAIACSECCDRYFPFSAAHLWKQLGGKSRSRWRRRRGEDVRWDNGSWPRWVSIRPAESGGNPNAERTNSANKRRCDAISGGWDELEFQCNGRWGIFQASRATAEPAPPGLSVSSPLDAPRPRRSRARTSGLAGRYPPPPGEVPTDRPPSVPAEIRSPAGERPPSTVTRRRRPLPPGRPQHARRQARRSPSAFSGLIGDGRHPLPPLADGLPTRERGARWISKPWR